MSRTTNKFSPEVRERAVRMVLDNPGQHGSRWQAIASVAATIECSANTANGWVEKAEMDSGRRAGLSSDTAAKTKALERENRELRQANERLAPSPAATRIGKRSTKTFRSQVCGRGRGPNQGDTHK